MFAVCTVTLPLVYDAIVLGGGPAGSVFAALVKRADPDRRVLVLEKDRFPRHHVGESLIAGIAPILARAGLLETLESLAESPSGVLRKAGIAYWWGEREGEGWTTDFRDPDTGRPVIGTYQVDRARFDALLLEHARSLGADVLEGARVQSAKRTETGWDIRYEIDGAMHCASSPLVVDASGLARLMARATGTSSEPFDDMSNYAVYGYWEGSDAYSEGPPAGERERWTFISTTELGWVWHIPLEGTRASVGLVTSKDALRDADDLEAFYREQVGKARTSTLLESATLDGELRVARDWSSVLARTCGEGWVAIGDAAGFVDPILTSGMLLAISGAAFAAAFAQTLWTSDVDPELLRTSYDETIRDRITAYHRLANIWYRRNDKVRSWWWEARDQALRSTQVTDDRRAFLAASLGLARDPHAAAAEKHLAFEPVRPDKELFAHHLFGEETERTLGDQLTRMTRFDAGERDARGAVHARLMERWRALLDSSPGLVSLQTVRRERYYCDRTMSRWEKAQFVELRASDDFLDRVVFVNGPVLEMLSGRGTLRSRLVAACPHPVGSAEERDWLHATWASVVQLDMRDWLDVDVVPRTSDRTVLETRALELAPTLQALEVGLLGRRLTLHLADAPIVDLVFAPTERAWKRVGEIAIGYRGAFDGDLLTGIAEAVRAADAALLGGMEGHCVELRDGQLVPTAPDQLSGRRDRGNEA